MRASASAAVLFVFGCNWLKDSQLFEYVVLQGCPTDESVGCYDESRSYIEFILRNYDSLPKKVVFVHGHN